jgi:hypothetical protein
MYIYGSGQPYMYETGVISMYEKGIEKLTRSLLCIIKAQERSKGPFAVCEIEVRKVERAVLCMRKL